MGDINKVADLALIEWLENMSIAGTAPAEYLPRIRERFQPEEWARACAAHGLPDGWESMEYPTFLAERRKLMADVVRQGYEALSSGGQTA